MVTIRTYDADDAEQVGRLIADTYSACNLAFLPPEERGPHLGPFRFAHSPDPAHQEAIAAVVWSPMTYVAEDDGQIVGVLRGRKERLASLFVHADHQRRGVGRRLVEHFEGESIAQGTTVLRVASTVYAVPFYTALGYKRSTGLRNGWSFEGRGLPVQPMKKRLVQL